MEFKPSAPQHPTLMETLCRALQWLEKTEDLDQETPALADLKQAILVQIANVAIEDREEPQAA
jgi:hypothetical protein